MRKVLAFIAEWAILLTIGIPRQLIRIAHEHWVWHQYEKKHGKWKP